MCSTQPVSGFSRASYRHVRISSLVLQLLHLTSLIRSSHLHEHCFTDIVFVLVVCPRPQHKLLHTLIGVLSTGDKRPKSSVNLCPQIRPAVPGSLFLLSGTQKFLELYRYPISPDLSLLVPSGRGFLSSLVFRLFITSSFQPSLALGSSTCNAFLYNLKSFVEILLNSIGKYLVQICTGHDAVIP